ncbi:MAG TPA: hypothetical protein VHF69_11135 [Candidatus Synoicihabitans sp.]|nr:hypothetical protein [Candidatus Synoicihabitans sp.]
MTLVLLFVCLAYLFGAVALAMSLRAAPVGFEDEDGFHELPQPWPVFRDGIAVE